MNYEQPKQTSKPITQREIEFARAIIAAYQAKLLAVVELPKPFDKQYDEIDREEFGIYGEGQLQQYAAAAAAQARNQALEEAKELLTKLDSVIVNLKIYEAVTAIEQLKEKS